MAVKVATRLFNLFHFSSKNGKNVLATDSLAFKRQNLFHTLTSQSKNRIKFHKLLINYVKNPAITLTVGGIGLCVFSYIRQSDFFKNNILPVVNASSDVPKKPASVRHVYNFIADIVEKSANAVVCIEIMENPLYSNKFKHTGSGFVVKEDGLILTNAHVISNKMKGRIQIRLKDGRTFQGHVEDYDLSLDLATIRINAKELPVMTLGVSSDLRAGEWVVAIGSPLSLTNTVTSGVVSSTNRSSKELRLHNKNMEYIQTDAAITFGNSGGPLVNLDGEVIGINSIKVTNGISFAIPVEYAKRFLEKSEKKRSFTEKIKLSTPDSDKKGYLGVSMITLTPHLIEELLRSELISETVTSGVLVWRVAYGSPAHRGGLLPGDVILSLNDQPIEGVRNIYDTVKPKEEIGIKIFRKGKTFDVKVTPEEAIW